MEYVLAKDYSIDGRKTDHIHGCEICPVGEYYRKQKKVIFYSNNHIVRQKIKDDAI